jgi:hypothetical protein
MARSAFREGQRPPQQPLGGRVHSPSLAEISLGETLTR